MSLQKTATINQIALEFGQHTAGIKESIRSIQSLATSRLLALEQLISKVNSEPVLSAEEKQEFGQDVLGLVDDLSSQAAELIVLINTETQRLKDQYGQAS